MGEDLKPMERVRTLPNGYTLGVAHDSDGHWYVWEERSHQYWHKHCGPYSDREQAIDWIASLAAAPPQGGEG